MVVSMPTRGGKKSSSGSYTYVASPDQLKQQHCQMTSPISVLYIRSCDTYVHTMCISAQIGNNAADRLQLSSCGSRDKTVSLDLPLLYSLPSLPSSLTFFILNSTNLLVALIISIVHYPQGFIYWGERGGGGSFPP